MIPRLDPDAPIDPATGEYLRELKNASFLGKRSSTLADRVVRSTDNSIYQMLPSAVIEPRNHADCKRALTLLADPRFRTISLTPRGGGTGTSAMSLNTGIIMDFVQMNAITHNLPDEPVATVGPGVVLASLNTALKHHGYMFAPNISSGSRATIGGMIATDAAGKGSAIYGKTSNHVLALRVIFPGGEEAWTDSISEETLQNPSKDPGPLENLCRTADDIDRTLRNEIDRAFPTLPRFVTGYNLPMIRRNPQGRFSLNYLLCGSEGTLAIITEAKLKLTPIPKHRTLVALQYTEFQSAVEDTARIAQTNPAAIETMDATLLDLARTDASYPAVKHIIAPDSGAMTLVEYTSDDADEANKNADHLAATSTCVSHTVTQTEADNLWTLRKRSVGLLGNLPGNRKPVPFVEDAAVPPENLPAFIRGFTEILEKENLSVGMFGHLDAGVIHIRPALDLTLPQDRKMIRRLSDSIAELAKSCGGVLWGEHGKGVRAEYNNYFFGSAITNAMQRIKTAADPHNQLNPGKIATPTPTTAVLLTIESTTRGELDEQVPREVRDSIEDPFRCNGSADCHNADTDTVMCPSWKSTHDRAHSPKGRADLMREWLRRLAAAETDRPRARPLGPIHRWINARTPAPDFSHEVKAAMDGCLACKACAGQCPVKVDVPAFRAEFLQRYHTRYPRRLRDYLVANAETLLPLAARLPTLARLTAPTAKIFSLVDQPKPATPSLRTLLRDRPQRTFDISTIQPGDTVVVQDVFTSCFTPHVVTAMLRIAHRAGVRAHLMPLTPTGKPLHVGGFLRRFRPVAIAQAARLEEVADTGATLVGIDPATTLLYRDEYPKALGQSVPRVLLPQEWIAALNLSSLSAHATKAAYFPHCTERAMEPAATALWTSVFTQLGVTLETREAGCCGMAGAYGHQREHYEQSRGIFGNGWKQRLDTTPTLVTGYSCRSQIERFAPREIRHPVELIADVVGGQERPD